MDIITSQRWRQFRDGFVISFAIKTTTTTELIWNHRWNENHFFFLLWFYCKAGWAYHGGWWSGQTAVHSFRSTRALLLCAFVFVSDGVYQYMCGCIPNLESFYFCLFSKPTHCASHALVTRTLEPPVKDLGLQNKKPWSRFFFSPPHRIIMNFTSFYQHTCLCIWVPFIFFLCGHLFVFVNVAHSECIPTSAWLTGFVPRPRFVLDTLKGCGISGSWTNSHMFSKYTQAATSVQRRACYKCRISYLKSAVRE